MQIHFRKFEPDMKYSLMVYDGDLYNYIEKSVPDAKDELKDELITLCANLLNELGIYLTDSEVKNE